MSDADRKEFESDHCSEPGAKALAQRITEYWRGRGYKDVFAIAYPAEVPGAHATAKNIYVVKTNLRSGYPPSVPLPA